MITTIEASQNGHYDFTQGEELMWSINIDTDNKARTLGKNSKDSHMMSAFPTFASADMLELITFCMGEGYYVKSEIIEQVIDYAVTQDHAVSDGVMSGFADYLAAFSIEVDPAKLDELEAYCLANSYQFDSRLTA